MIFFPGQGKVREFCWWPGKFRKDLESQGKVGEFENKWLWQAVFRKFLYSVQEGKECTFSWDSLSPSSSSLGATLKEKSLLPLGAYSFQIWSNTVCSIKVKNKNDFNFPWLSQGALRFAPVRPSVCPSVHPALRYRVCVINISHSF